MIGCALISKKEEKIGFMLISVGNHNESVGMISD